MMYESSVRKQQVTVLATQILRKTREAILKYTTSTTTKSNNVAGLQSTCKQGNWEKYS